MKHITPFFHKHKILFLLMILVIAQSCSQSDEDDNLIVKYNSRKDQFFGPLTSVDIVKNFPAHFYDIHEVNTIGRFYVDHRHDIIKNVIRRGLIWEPEIVSLLKKYTRPDSTVIDCGSHMGTHTILLSKLVGNKGTVVAFEPQTKLFQELVNNIKLNESKNVIAYRCAVGKSSGVCTLEKPIVDNEGGTKLGDGGEEVQIIPIDTLNLENVSLIKIDVENHEYDVLLGARKTIVKNQPIIVMEVLGNVYIPIIDREAKQREIFNFLDKLGYVYSYIEGSWSDWIAIPKHAQ